jgi:hypothetical protein
MDGLGVEDAAGDEVLEEALEAFEEAARAGADGSDSGAESGAEPGAEPGGDVTLEESGSAGEGAEASPGSGTPGGTAGRPGTMSDAEELATLNRQLEQALERFDGDILTERDTIAGMENADKGGSSEGEEEGDAGEMGGAEGSGQGTQAGMPGSATADTGDSGQGAIPASPGSRGQGDYRHPSSADTIPPDIPDGSDDDVVARQIREAAMAETDPELREKLWEEYRKYKKGN